MTRTMVILWGITIFAVIFHLPVIGSTKGDYDAESSKDGDSDYYRPSSENEYETEGDSAEGSFKDDYDTGSSKDGDSEDYGPSAENEYEAEGYSAEKLQERTENPLTTACYSPSPQPGIEDCVENLDPEIVENCLPGLNKVLSDAQLENADNGSFLKNSNDSEVCIRQVFGRCSYDSRYRIKTKIKQVIGLNLDIAFQDEFEMDDCDENNVAEMMTDIARCHEKELKHPKSSNNLPKDDNEIPTYILDDSSNCVEDHTTFTCVLNNKTLFTSTMAKLMSMLKKFSLQRLESEVPGNTNRARLCFVWLDWFRMENCENDFYEYVLCLKNGTVNAKLFRKFHACTANALNVCPKETTEKLIQILVGAVEGRSGKEPQDGGPKIGFSVYGAKGGVDDMHIPGVERYDLSSCGSELFSKWAKKIKKCSAAKTDTISGKKKVERILNEINNCMRTTKGPDCSYHKFSHFQKALTIIMRDVIKGQLKGKYDGSSSEEQEYSDESSSDEHGVQSYEKKSFKKCMDEISFRRLKDCIVEFYLYFARLHHAHHTLESLNMQLAKIKICMQSILKDCTYGAVHKLLELFATLTGIKIPKLLPPNVVTKLSLPEGVVWCETALINHHYKIPTEVFKRRKTIPPTKLIVHHWTNKVLQANKKPTTLRSKTRTVEQIVKRITKAPPVTDRIHITPKTKLWNIRRTPTTAKSFQKTLVAHHWHVHRPGVTPSEHEITFAPKKQKHMFTPTTAVYSNFSIATKINVERVSQPVTKTVRWKKKTAKYNESITPTIIYFKTFVPTTHTLRKERPVPPTKKVTEKMKERTFHEKLHPTVVQTTRIKLRKKTVDDVGPDVQTKLVKHTMKTRTHRIKIKPTAVIQDVLNVTRKRQLITFRPALTQVTHLPFLRRTYKHAVAPETVRFFNIHVTPVYITDQKLATTSRVHMVKHKTKIIELTEKPIIPEVQAFSPEERTIKQHKRPTKTMTEIVTFKPQTEAKQMDIQTVVERYTQKGRRFKDILTPTTLKKFHAIMPGEACNQPLQQCVENVKRYYFDAQENQCKGFIYGGCGGNKNNFFTHDECQETCMDSVCLFKPGAVGSCQKPMKDEAVRFYYEPKEKCCKQFKYSGCGGNKNNFESMDKCELKCSLTDCCFEEPAFGYCKDNVTTRYFYNPETKTCAQFEYGGCGGNKNNFQSVRECRNTCNHADYCRQPADMGSCQEVLNEQLLFYYDVQEGKCKELRSKNCEKYPNTFPTLKECQAVCMKPKACLLPLVTCRKGITRFYFDKEAEICKAFVFGGCDSNGNNFYTVHNCETSCRQSVTRLNPVTRIEEHTPRTRVVAEKMTPTEVHLARLRVTAVNYTDKMEPTTVKINVVRPKEEQEEHTEVFTTRVITFPKIKHHHTEAMKPTVTFMERITPKTRVTTERVFVPSTEKNVFRPARRTHREFIGHTTHRQKVVSVPAAKIHRTMPTFIPKMKTFRPKPKTIIVRLTPTTVRTFRLGVKSEVYVDKKTQTTAFTRQRPLLTRIMTKIVAIPATKKVIYEFIKKYHQHHVTPTTVQYRIVKVPTKTVTDILPLPRTKTNVVFKTKIYRDRVTETTVRNVSVPIEQKTITLRYSKITPKVIQKRICEEKIEPCHKQNGNESRYFFDFETRTCIHLKFGDCEGSQNNFFKSRKECQETCLGSRSVKKPAVFNIDEVCLMPLKSCRGKEKSYTFDFIGKKCKPSKFEGCKINFKTRGECQKMCLKPDYCYNSAVAKSRDCPQNSTRFYYDHKDKTCKQTRGGSCEKSEKFLKSYHECQMLCTTPEECLDDSKLCNRSSKHYYFDVKKGKCREFVDEGCNVNGNNFNSLSDCQDKCSTRSVKKPAPYNIGPNECFDTKVSCAEEKVQFFYDIEEGECAALVPNRDCHDYDYNFYSLPQCQQECMHRYKEIITPTTVKYASFIPEGVFVTDQMDQTTAVVFKKPIKPRTTFISMKIPTTKIIHVTQPRKDFREKVTRPTTKVQHLTPRTKTIKDFVKVSTRKMEMTRPERIFHERFEAPSTSSIKHTAPRRFVHKTLHIVSQKHTVPFNTRKVIVEVTPGRYITQVFHVRPKVYTDIIAGTTTKHHRRKPAPRTAIFVESPVTPSIVRFSAGTQVQEEIIRPTKLRTEEFELPTSIIHERIPVPRPTVYRFSVPERKHKHRIAPTTLKTHQHVLTTNWQRARKTHGQPVSEIYPRHTVRYTARVERIKTQKVHHSRPEKRYSERIRAHTTKSHKVNLRTKIHTEEEDTPYTESIKFDFETKIYHCLYPQPKRTTITRCYKILKACTEERKEKWKTAVKDCTLRELNRMGYKINTDNNTLSLQKFEQSVSKCTRNVEDSECASESINMMQWILEKEIIIVGRYAEHIHQKKSGYSDGNFTESLKKCVALVDDEKMERCHPGLHEILNDIVLFGETRKTLVLHKMEEGCLPNLMGHCNKSDIMKLENIGYTIYGVCIRFSPSDQESGCKNTFQEHAKKSCDELHARLFLGHVDRCVKALKEEQNYEDETLNGNLDNIKKCMEEVTFLDCVYKDWETFRLILTYVITRTTTTPGGDWKCKRHMTLPALKPCVQNLLVLTSTFQNEDEAGSKRPTKVVAKCFREKLKICGVDITNKFIYIVQMLTNAGNFQIAEVPDPDDSNVGATISSVKVTKKEINMCEIEKRDVSNYAETPEEYCEGVYLSAGETKYILQKKCSSQSIKKWLEELSSCVDSKATDLGLKNPETLTINRVLTMTKNCLGDVKNIQCRPYLRKDFKTLLKSFLTMVRRFAVSSKSEECHKQLSVNNTAHCISGLHNYLVMKHFRSNAAENKKCLDCISKAWYDCPSHVSKNTLDVLESSVRQNMYLLGAGNDADYTICEPEIHQQNWNGLNECDPWMLMTGRARPVNLDEDGNPDSPENEDYYSPGDFEITDFNEKLKRRKQNKKRDGSLLQMRLNPVELESDEEDELTTLPYDPAIDSRLQNEIDCRLADYTKYFSNVTKCQQIRLNILFDYEGDSCLPNGKEKFWEAMALCLMEDVQYKLPCNFRTKKQIDDFLLAAAAVMNNYRSYKDKLCSDTEPCYGESVPLLYKCSGVIYDQLHFSHDMHDAFDSKKEFTKLLTCLKHVMPACPANVSLLSLPSVYIPLGISFNDSVVQKRNKKCISLALSHKNEEYHCQKSDNDAVVADIAACLDRVVTKLKNVLISFGPNHKHPWGLDPLNACVITHTLTECRHTDLHVFKSFMQELLDAIQKQLRNYLAIFNDSKNLPRNKKCISQFSASSLDMCLSVMFGYMNSYHSGRAKSSDYPSQCVEEIFESCGNISGIHMFMKKSMNVPIVDEEKDTDVNQDEEVCLKAELGLGLPRCIKNNFEDFISGNEDCTDVEHSVQTSLHTDKIMTAILVCKNCVLKNVDQMCFYDTEELKEISRRALSSIAKCLAKYDVSENCIQDIAHLVRNNCINKMHEYASNLRNSLVMAAAEASEEFSHCIEETVTSCPQNTHDGIFDVYIRIFGFEVLSHFDKRTNSTIL